MVQPQPGALCCCPHYSKGTPSLPFPSTENMLPPGPGAVEAVPSPALLQEPDQSTTGSPGSSVGCNEQSMELSKNIYYPQVANLSCQWGPGWTCEGDGSPGAALAPQTPVLQPPAHPQVLRLQELGLHPGHLTELLGVCPWALHLTPADGHHLHPWGRNMSGLLLPKLAFLHVEREAAASVAPQAGMRQNCFSLGPVSVPVLSLPASLRATTTPSSFSAVLSR